MLKHSHGELVLFSYQLFQSFDMVSNVVSSRLGGVSTGYLQSLNLSFRVGDAEQAVLTNRLRFYNTVDIDPEMVAQAQLVHGSRIAVVTDHPLSGYIIASRKPMG